MRPITSLLCILLCIACVSKANTLVPYNRWMDLPYSDSTQYSNELGEYAVGLSAVAYCPESEVADWSCLWCQRYPGVQIQKTYWDRWTSTFGYLAYDISLDWHILAFEGSQDLLDWISNLQIDELVPYKDHPDARVHHGFWVGYAKVRDQILRDLVERNVSRLFLTGHSRGAAEATLAALDIREELGNISMTMVNFGSPRVGNQAYSSLFESEMTGQSKWWRVTHARDPVPRLPPRLFGYYHISNEIWYPDNTLKYVVCPEPESPSCLDGMRFYPFATEDHVVYLDVPVSKCE